MSFFLLIFSWCSPTYLEHRSRRYILNLYQVGDENADHNIGYRPNAFGSILSKAISREMGVLIWQLCEILRDVILKDDVRIVELKELINI